MVEKIDVGSFLQNGYWANTRVRTPDPKLPHYSYNEYSVPRTSHTTEYPPELRRRSFYPPTPTVEDEVESLAKEHGSVVGTAAEEEPKHRGSVDQYPILELLHEHNPERRFVLVGDASVSSSDAEQDNGHDVKPKQVKTDRAESKEAKNPRPAPKETYEANTRRKYELRTTDDDGGERKRERGERDKSAAYDKPLNRERRKSRLEELPAIVTDLRPDDRSSSQRDDIRRTRSAAAAESDGTDYFSVNRRKSSRNESLLSPEVIKHSTKGRDRAYYDYSGSNTPNQSRARPSSIVGDPYDRTEQRRDDRDTRPYSTSPVDTKRHEIPRHVRRTSKESYHTHDRDDKRAESRRNAPPELGRKDSSTSHSRPHRDSLRPRSGSFRDKRGSPPRENSRHSSEEDVERRAAPRRRGKSFVHEDRNGYLATPTEAVAAGRRSKPSSPLQSPRISQEEFDNHDRAPPRSPRSATFSNTKEWQRVGAENPARPLSRSSTSRSVLNSATPIAIPIITAAAAAATMAQEPGTPGERRSSALPPPPPAAAARQSTHSLSNSHSSVSPPSSSPARQLYQPPQFDPDRDGVHTGNPSGTYRRYSQNLAIGEPGEPSECDRTVAVAGYVDWLTLPNCNNFDICPTCYQATFANTSFRNVFVPAPFRPQDRAFKCDFGASTWYQIAWFLTQHRQLPDARLFRGLANVTASHQPCSEMEPAYRIWYTIRDPFTQRPVRNFKVCHHCAKSVEVLLPSLSGAFVPMDSPAESTLGTCELAQHAFGRPRQKFIKYFETMEVTCERALATSSAPDIRSLADRIRELTLIDECFASQPINDRRWHTMRSIPNFTVCEECFNEVIWPEIESGSSSVPADFYYSPQKLEVASCQLYSPRMRRAFQKAVADNDLGYFEARVRKRMQKESEFHDRIRGLDAGVLGSDWVQAEVDRLKREWSRHE